MTAERDAFGPKLRAEREHRGISLSSVAASTKIARPLLEALERNDFSRWPPGIYRLAFVRAYLVAIGLPSEPWVAEFARLFPSDGAAVRADRADTLRAEGARGPRTPSLRLQLEPPNVTRRQRYLAFPRWAPSLLEWSAVVCAGALVAWTAEASILTCAGVIALAYYPVMNALGRGSLAVGWQRRHATQSANPFGTRTGLAVDETAIERLGRLSPHLDEPVRTERIAPAVPVRRRWQISGIQRSPHWFSSARGRVQHAAYGLRSTFKAVPEYVGRFASRYLIGRRT